MDDIEDNGYYWLVKNLHDGIAADDFKTAEEAFKEAGKRLLEIAGDKFVELSNSAMREIRESTDQIKDRSIQARGGL